MAARRVRSLHAGRNSSRPTPGQKYLDICRTVKDTVPQMHMHAFSPLEIHQGAQTLGIPVIDFLRELKAAGLDTLPGTAAEILDDEVRVVLCADKIRTQQWLDVMRAAHTVGFRSTATIMFGHIEGYQHWARHLLRVRNLQSETGGFTEFVPLPFVHMEAPIYLKGRARPGPTFREAILMHAVARLVLNPLIPEHPGVLGQARRRRRAPVPVGRGQRSRRHADG